MSPSDPAATLAWLRQPRAAVVKRFHDLGPVHYKRFLQSCNNHKRAAYMADARCEIDGCVSSDAAAQVFDHCHRHGWIRAVLCNAHNVRFGHLEAAWLEHGIDLSGTPYWRVLMSCIDCQAAEDERLSA